MPYKMTECRTIYRFDELSDRAREIAIRDCARQWGRWSSRGGVDLNEITRRLLSESGLRLPNAEVVASDRYNHGNPGSEASIVLKGWLDLPFFLQSYHDQVRSLELFSELSRFAKMDDVYYSAAAWVSRASNAFSTASSEIYIAWIDKGVGQQVLQTLLRHLSLDVKSQRALLASRFVSSADLPVPDSGKDYRPSPIDDALARWKREVDGTIVGVVDRVCSSATRHLAAVAANHYQLYFGKYLTDHSNTRLDPAESQWFDQDGARIPPARVAKAQLIPDMPPVGVCRMAFDGDNYQEEEKKDALQNDDGQARQDLPVQGAIA